MNQTFDSGSPPSDRVAVGRIILALALCIAIALAVALSTSRYVNPQPAHAAACDPELITGGGGSLWQVDETDGTWADGTLIPKLGGVVRWDAFDGYGKPSINGVDYDNSSPNGCSRASRGREVIFPTDVVAGISMRPELYFDGKRRAARELVTLVNTTGSPVTFDFRWNGDLGSDNGTRTSLTSSGDPVADDADLWATSCEDYENDGCGSGPAERDPELAHIWEGADGPESADFVEITDGNYINIEFELTLDPSESISLMHWGYMAPNIGKAINATEAMAQAPDWMFGGLTIAERNRIANW